MHKRPLAVIAVFFILGIILGRFLPDSVSIFHVFVVTLILITISFILSMKAFSGEIGRTQLSSALPRTFRPRSLRSFAPRNDKGRKTVHVFLFLSIISLGALLYLNSNIFQPNHISYFLGKDKVKAEIIGVIKSPAEARWIYYGKISSRYVFELESIGVLKITGLASIRIQTEKDYQYGDRLIVKGIIKRPFESVIATPSEAKGKQSHKKEIASSPSAPRNDRGKGARNGIKNNDKSRFNYSEYLENQNIFAIINASEKNVTLLSHNYKSNPILRYAYLIREKIKNQFLEKMPLESGAFLKAILLGDRSELPKKLNESFRNSGTMHILPT